MHGLMMDYPLTIDRILEHNHKLYSRKEVVSLQADGSTKRVSYGELYTRCKRLAKALGTLGVGIGDKVGTFAWNHHQHVELYFGIPGAGAVCHTLNLRLFPEQLAYIVNHAQDKVVFIDASVLPLYERVADGITCVEHYVILNGTPDLKTSLPNVIHYEELLASTDDNFTWLSTDERMAAGLCYTSGTTGDPKGALYSHRSTFLHAYASNQASALGLLERDNVLMVVPQFHVMAWGLPYAAAMSGANQIMPAMHLQPVPLAKLIEEEKVTVAAGVPTIWNGLYQELKINPRDISSIRSLIVGGSAMPKTLTRAFESELGVHVLHAWGMTETSPLGTVCNLQSQHLNFSQQEMWDVKALQGYPIMGIDVRIADEEGNEQPWDGQSIGEIQVRGPWVISQYYKREGVDPSHTPDGWFRTGDVASMTSDGYLRITDRTKDLIKSGGEWISSVDLENTLMSHDAILEAAVIAIPDKKWQERPMAVIVLHEGVEMSTDDIQTYLADKVAKWWIPEGYAFVKEIPKTSVGKFSKRTLREQYEQGKLQASL